MSKSNYFETEFLALTFNGDPIPNLADNASVAPLTDIFISLHTASPGEAGLQNTNECTYTGYARVAVARTSGGWTITGNSVSPNNPIDFGTATAGSETATHMGVGVAVAGATQLLYYGTLTPNIVITTGVTPRLTTATTITED